MRNIQQGPRFKPCGLWFSPKCYNLVIVLHFGFPDLVDVRLFYADLHLDYRAIMFTKRGIENI